MPEKVIQITTDTVGWLYALCESGRIYRTDLDEKEKEWEQVMEPPKKQYKKASS